MNPTGVLKRLAVLAACGIGCLPSLAFGQEGDGVDPAPEPIHVLKAQREGRIDLVARGNGVDRVRFDVRNNTDRRLKILLPPGLVAASSLGQAGGGFQSMGLGTPTTRAGSFGQFQPVSTSEGFRSVPPTADEPPGIVVPPGVNIHFLLPSVCLNYGVATPTAQNVFHLMDVDEYTQDPRARKALRSLATLGTGQTVAQAVAWAVFNHLSLGELLSQTALRMNEHEVALAGRILEELDRSGSTGLIEPGRLQASRLFVRVQGTPGVEKDADRLHESLAGERLLGLPITMLPDQTDPRAGVAAVSLRVLLQSTQPGQTRGKLFVRSRGIDGVWRQVGSAPWKLDRYAGDLQGPEFARDLDRAIAQAFVGVRVANRTANSTVFRIDNRLPMSIASVVLRAGPDAEHAAPVELNGLGIAPMRNVLAPVPAAKAVVERVAVNGL